MADHAEDFDEEYVWSSFKEIGRAKDSTSRQQKYQQQAQSVSKVLIPRSNASTSSVRSTLEKSAPVSIPDWSKIYSKSYNEDQGQQNCYYNEDSVVVDDDDEDCSVPPHEWLARKMARSQISSFSVCEGAGRTLKGRDLSKVRNAVLTKTGFLE